jgi:hypothetical protein
MRALEVVERDVLHTVREATHGLDELLWVAILVPVDPATETAWSAAHRFEDELAVPEASAQSWLIPLGGPLQEVFPSPPNSPSS